MQVQKRRNFSFVPVSLVFFSCTPDFIFVFSCMSQGWGMNPQEVHTTILNAHNNGPGQDAYGWVGCACIFGFIACPIAAQVVHIHMTRLMKRSRSELCKTIKQINKTTATTTRIPLLPPTHLSGLQQFYTWENRSALKAISHHPTAIRLRGCSSTVSCL